ncbi:hypothetical protein SAMN04489726_7702 [Allokutzneria albata]|uniref:Uncharacterized protein n=1 Tax=Allokutzneria albata TaxID=211114 RepID=A0A1H0DBV2_ALLAB|nr:hypothetical protein SAMN04489726_7702 [Allokutzneria albata]
MRIEAPNMKAAIGALNALNESFGAFKYPNDSFSA